MLAAIKMSNLEHLNNYIVALFNLVFLLLHNSLNKTRRYKLKKTPQQFPPSLIIFLKNSPIAKTCFKSNKV
ncbi:hypothetical protein CWB77_06710 [Pseudoalteromonas sp. S1610]|nr:hypothetical protein CWB77_06710 [Pseudoalteromonas sp. S1610]